MYFLTSISLPPSRFTRRVRGVLLKADHLSNVGELADRKSHVTWNVQGERISALEKISALNDSPISFVPSRNDADGANSSLPQVKNFKPGSLRVSDDGLKPWAEA